MRDNTSFVASSSASTAIVDQSAFQVLPIRFHRRHPRRLSGRQPGDVIVVLIQAPPSRRSRRCISPQAPRSAGRDRPSTCCSSVFGRVRTSSTVCTIIDVVTGIIAASSLKRRLREFERGLLRAFLHRGLPPSPATRSTTRGKIWNGSVERSARPRVPCRGRSCQRDGAACRGRAPRPAGRACPRTPLSRRLAVLDGVQPDSLHGDHFLDDPQRLLDQLRDSGRSSARIPRDGRG